jgi:hypothetical protein
LRWPISPRAPFRSSAGHSDRFSTPPSDGPTRHQPRRSATGASWPAPSPAPPWPQRAMPGRPPSVWPPAEWRREWNLFSDPGPAPRAWQASPWVWRHSSWDYWPRAYNFTISSRSSA